MKLGSSFSIRSLSSALLSFNLSPSFPEYLWKVETITCSACSRGCAMADLGARDVGRGLLRARPEAQSSLPSWDQLAQGLRVQGRKQI